MKQFLSWILYGIAMCIGWMIVQFIAALMTDPYKRANFKQKFKETFRKD